MEQGIQLISSTFFKYDQVLLGPKILDITRKKINQYSEDNKNRISTNIKRFYKRELKFSVIKEKYSKLTADIIEKLSIQELKDII